MLGRILYLKATLTGGEPVDVLEYAHENPLFPHQSTGDQFFSEPQFESYRRLGYCAALRVFAPAGPLPSPAILFEPTRYPRFHPPSPPASLRVKYARTWATSRSR